MADKAIDCCGYSCPEPVIMARKALMEAGSGKVQVKVSTAVARDNVSRAARGMGWSVQVEETDGIYLLALSR
ncbi:MAG TPA: preprotein translocase subunit TatB [Firmicutes bacterium]|nr:preprotein translocase subunit TatB [Bacillota bacterium]